MRSHRHLAAGLTSLIVLGVSVVWAEPRRAERQARPLDPGVVSIRLLLGVGDAQEQSWGGRMEVDKGEILGVEGWRFREGDRVKGTDSWEAQTRRIRKTAPAKQTALQKAGSGPGTAGPQFVPNGVVVSLKAPDEATLSVQTERGKFAIPLADLADGSPRRYLDGKVEARRVPPGIPLRDEPEQEDFPAAAADARGGVWVAYVVHEPRGPEVSESFRERPKDFSAFVPKGGGDQVKLLRLADGRPGRPIDVTAGGLDVWRPAVALAGDGKVVVAWSECRDGNWDLYARRYDPDASAWSDAQRLTTNPGTDADVALATAPDGTVWMAWQAWVDGQADIVAGPLGGEAKAIPFDADRRSNEWSPALAVDRSGRVHVAFDSYRAGNYDVYLATLGGPGGKAVAIAGTARFEARPSVAVDARGRIWVAYEERTADWGKDAENLIEGQGTSLYRVAAVRVRCLDDGRVLEAPDPVAQAPEGLRALNSYPRLAADRDGRIWLAFRHRQEAIWGNNSVLVVGGVWLEYATSLDGRRWAAPQVLPRSDGLLDNRPALVQPAGGPMLIVYSGDGRLRREVEFTPELQTKHWTHSGTPAGVVDNDVQVAALTPSTTGAVVEPALVGPPTARPDDDKPTVHPNEAADVGRMRNHRIQAGGKTYRLLRGEFHRHTEISQDGGSDGSLEDMWRYALDAAHLDWMGNGDHDNGGGKEYTWWLVQKTTDLYHTPPAFVPMYCYERSVAYPHGHRNVMFDRRGIRTLPRLVGQGGVVDEDTPMLYDYLKELGGICASHTSGTGMGTDWRDVNPAYEPFVEIFQGHRNSYEHLGGPRVARRASEAIGGWRPLGMVWNALAMQYKVGFQASSDHISTHISFAVAIAEDYTRPAILDAFRRRHCYGATDNILLDVRSGEHLMGDEFDADGPVRLKVMAHGTGPIARVDIIKDFKYVYSTEPGTDRVEFTWTDAERRPPGQSWYYVRVLQEDGEIAWGSPFWVNRRGEGGG